MPARKKATKTQNAAKKRSQTLVDILVAQKVLDSKQAEQVKFAEIQTGKSQEDILKGQKLVDETGLTKAKAEFYNIPYIDISTTPVSPEALATLPQEVAQRHKVFPVSVDATTKQIDLAMADPLDLTAIEFVEQKTGMLVKPHAAEPSRIETSLLAGYSTTLAKEVTEALREVSQESKVKVVGVQKTGLIREEKVAEIVTHVLGFAIKARASDVHIEPQGMATRVRYRIDGILQEKLTTPRELHDAIVSRIKILSGMKIDEKRIPQDGRFNFKAEGQEVDLRVSTLPTTLGEKVVMRLLKKTGGIPTLQELGLRGRALKNLREAILRPHGIVVICGPTGSGKTTTLYSIIQEINTTKVNIVTLEDPVEYKVSGVNQVQINPDAGLTFASGLRSFLRQDPNIILVGEIRDEETADLAIQASLTGHLVFSTLHTSNASGTLPRLLDMNAEPYLLASSMTRLVEEIKSVLDTLWPKGKEVNFYKGKGCEACGKSGYFGRIGIFEVLPISEKVSRLILERSTSGDIDRQAREEGMVVMKQDGYLKVLEGVTTVEEVLRVAQE
jgi:type II secretory ATPase GspE/PulE/Tfp pilus assembly ATPase PilB-like protein